MGTDTARDIFIASLKRRQEAADLTDAALARKAGLSHTGVRDIYIKMKNMPRYDTLAALAGVLKCTVYDLVNNTDAGGLSEPGTVPPQYQPKEEVIALLIETVLKLHDDGEFTREELVKFAPKIYVATSGAIINEEEMERLFKTVLLTVSEKDT